MNYQDLQSAIKLPNKLFKKLVNNPTQNYQMAKILNKMQGKNGNNAQISIK